MDTQQKILNSAKELFIKKGFKGTSISEIGKIAEVTPSLIYHYFGSKEGLWKAVKLEILKKYEGVDDLISQDESNLNAFLAQVIVQRYKFYSQNPEAIRLRTWQKLEEKQELLAGGNPIAPQHWKDKIIKLQELGFIRKDLDPDMIILFILSIISGAFSEDSQDVLSTARKKEEYLDNLMDWVRRAIEP